MCHHNWWMDRSRKILEKHRNPRFNREKWIQGPDLAVGIKAAACVALPLSSNFACVVVGGWTKKEYYSSNVYGLDKSLTEWTFLGKIRNGRRSHIALPIS